MRKTLYVALLLICLTTLASAQAKPQPAKIVFEQWLAALNPKDSTAIGAFIQKYKRQYTVQDELDFRESMGQLEVLEIQSPSDSEITALVRGSESDNVLLVTLAVSPTDANNITLFRLEGATAPERFRVQRLSQVDTLAQARSRLASMRDADKLAGVILVAQAGQTIFSWSGGPSDRHSGTPISLDTRFRLASVGKMFTAVAVLQLVETGKVGLDDAVGRYVKHSALAAASRQITIRQLLNHTSGLGDVFGGDFQKNAGKLRTLDDYINLYGQQRPAFEPGTQEKYSNFGYILLGAVIESASGLDYYKYVKRKVFVPAGMSRTGFEPEVRKPTGLARPYTKEEKGWVDAGATLPWRGTPAGGGYSTAADLLRFSRALQAGRLLSSQWLDTATTGQNIKGWYGFGFMVNGRGAEARYGHEGGAPGMNAAFFIYPTQGYTVIGLGNLDPSTVGQVVNFIGNRLPIDK